MDFRPSGRVVVTGLGVVSPLGTGVEKTWSAMLAGANGAGPITHFDASAFSTRIGAEVKDFNPEDWLDRKDAKRVDPFIAMAVAGATQALEDSAFPLDDSNRHLVGCLIGSGVGGHTFLNEQLKKLYAEGPSKISPFLVPYIIPDMASGFTSIVHGLQGPNTCVVTACATGANCIGDAYHMVKRGDAVAMVAGGSEAPINEIGLAGFCSSRAMTTRNDDPLHASRPFDAGRDGFLIGEGSAVVILEDYDHAVARGAKIYGELVGYGQTGDGHHITQPLPDGGGAIRSMKMALRTAGLEPKDIDYINAHGTSTPLNDRSETAAILQVFGSLEATPPMSSTKSMVGHMLGAAGAIESMVCLLTLRDQKLAPTINYEVPDPDCPLDCVPNESREAKVNVAMTNSFGFGGHNATLIFRKV